jgi:hypothetical protein
LVRYSGATVDLENPVGSMVEDRTVLDSRTVGGLQLIGGVRFRL